MLHGFGLALGGDHLGLRFGLGLLLALHLLGVGLELGLLDLLFLQFERVLHLLRRQLFGEQAFHALAVLGREIDVAEEDRADVDAVLGKLVAQLLFDHALQFGALFREDLFHREFAESSVEDAVHYRLDQVLAHVAREAAGDLGDAVGIERVADAQFQADGETFDRLEGSLAA